LPNFLERKPIGTKESTTRGREEVLSFPPWTLSHAGQSTKILELKDLRAAGARGEKEKDGEKISRRKGKRASYRKSINSEGVKDSSCRQRDDPGGCLEQMDLRKLKTK